MRILPTRNPIFHVLLNVSIIISMMYTIFYMKIHIKLDGGLALLISITVSIVGAFSITNTLWFLCHINDIKNSKFRIFLLDDEFEQDFQFEINGISKGGVAYVDSKTFNNLKVSTKVKIRVVHYGMPASFLAVVPNNIIDEIPHDSLKVMISGNDKTTAKLKLKYS